MNHGGKRVFFQFKIIIKVLSESDVSSAVTKFDKKEGLIKNLTFKTGNCVKFSQLSVISEDLGMRITCFSQRIISCSELELTKWDNVTAPSTLRLPLLSSPLLSLLSITCNNKEFQLQRQY